MDYGLAQLSVRADRKKGSLGKPQSRRQWKRHAKIIRRLFKNIMREKLCRNEIAMSGLEITRKNHLSRQVTSSMQLQNRSFHWKGTAQNVLN